MTNVKLMECSQAIEDSIFKELYLSKLAYLERTLSYFDRKGIEATVIMNCNEKNGKLETSIEVICDDKGFREIIQEAIKQFDTINKDFTSS